MKRKTIQFLKNCLPVLKLSLCFIALIIIHIGAFGQEAEKKITGRIVSANGEPLIGVTVSVKNANRSTTTDDNGNFSLTVPANADAFGNRHFSNLSASIRIHGSRHCGGRFWTRCGSFFCGRFLGTGG